MKHQIGTTETVNICELDQFNFGHFAMKYGATVWGKTPNAHMYISTPNGLAKTFLGDVIVESENGTVSVYSPEEFKEQFEGVEL